MTICGKGQLFVGVKAWREAHLDANERHERKRKDYRDGRLARKPDEAEEEEKDGGGDAEEGEGYAPVVLLF